MYKFIHLFIVLIITIFSLPATVQAAEIHELNPTETLTLSSKYYQGELNFTITLPDSYHKNKDKKYVVLFDMHPRSQPYLSGMHDWVSHNGQWPWLHTIIVTPANRSNPPIGDMYQALIDDKNEHLLDFFEQDLLTAIDKKYRTNGFRIYNGFTGNATLGLYTLLHRPELFNAYIAASPVMSDNYLGINTELEKQLNQFTTKPRYLFLSAGNSNFEQANQAGMATLTKALKKHKPESLTITVKRFDDSFYMTQPVLAISYAIEEIFRDVHTTLAFDSAISQQGADAIIAHYHYLSEEKYGFEVSAQASLSKLGFSMIKSNPEQAINILKKSVATYPDNTFAHHDLANAYFQLSQHEKAIKQQTIAVEKSKALIAWHQRKQQSHLEKYQAALPK